MFTPALFVQGQVQTDRMQWLIHSGHVQFAMQQAAALEGMGGDIQFLPAQYGVTGQDGIAVMAVVVYCILAVGHVGPTPPARIFVLRHGRPVHETVGPAGMFALDLLEKHDVGVDTLSRSRSSCTTIRRLKKDNPLWML